MVIVLSVLAMKLDRQRWRQAATLAMSTLLLVTVVVSMLTRRAVALVRPLALRRIPAAPPARKAALG